MSEKIVAKFGGTSLAGGVGTISGALLGALVMQSLQSGMVLMGLDSPLQSIVVGIVLVVLMAAGGIAAVKAGDRLARKVDHLKGDTTPDLVGA